MRTLALGPSVELPVGMIRVRRQWTYAWGRDVMRILPLGPHVKLHPSGTRSVRWVCRDGRSDAVRILSLNPKVELPRGGDDPCECHAEIDAGALCGPYLPLGP